MATSPTFSILALLLALAGSHVVSINATESSFAEGQYPCGTILNETFGILQYKPFETVQKNERCVWILRVPGAVGYTFNMYNAYFDSFDNGLNIAGLTLGSHVPDNLTPRAIDTDYYVEGNMAILTAYSRVSSPDRGFSLFFTANVTGNGTQVSNLSVTQIVGDLKKDISHPLNTTGNANYTNNELSTFLFTPGFSRNSTGLKNEVLFNQLGLEGITCNDFLDIFEFDGNYGSVGWKRFGRFCGADTDVTFSANDMVLVAFHSDSSVTSRGFELNFERA